MRLGVLATHPIQYHAPLYRALAEELDLHVYYAHRQTPAGQAAAGFGVEFEWDVPLLDGYAYSFLENQARTPSVDTFAGCDTPQIAEHIASGGFDAFLVHGWYTKSYRQAMRACWRTRTPIFVRGDSQHVPNIGLVKRVGKAVTFRSFIPRFDRYLVVGQRARDYLLSYGADARRMSFAPHFVDNEFFRERARCSDPGATRRSIGAAPDAVLFVFVGKLQQNKRPGDLLSAAARLRDGGMPAEVLIVGSGALESALQQQAATLGVPTHFAGFKNQTELPAYYRAADALVLPSDWGETWGLVVNEAMACGIPAVVSQAAGCVPDLITPGHTGETYPVGDVAELEGALRRVVQLSKSQHLCRALDERMAVYSIDNTVVGVMESMDAVSPGRRTYHKSHVSVLVSP